MSRYPLIVRSAVFVAFALSPSSARSEGHPPPLRSPASRAVRTTGRPIAAANTTRKTSKHKLLGSVSKGSGDPGRELLSQIATRQNGISPQRYFVRRYVFDLSKETQPRTQAHVAAGHLIFDGESRWMLYLTEAQGNTLDQQIAISGSPERCSIWSFDGERISFIFPQEKYRLPYAQIGDQSSAIVDALPLDLVLFRSIPRLESLYVLHPALHRTHPGLWIVNAYAKDPTVALYYQLTVSKATLNVRDIYAKLAAPEQQHVLILYVVSEPEPSDVDELPWIVPGRAFPAVRTDDGLRRDQRCLRRWKRKRCCFFRWRGRRLR